ncbi:hypothetical protein BpHYR1_000891 [Brachionus plicatilis]|uniref:Uncharacterized protein n=1 Tax=Brachionus plicatilis TaxID=10195 RepID=A0A3M7SF40_BRAPC|nr:hypothetical protein BpHYR1_000891 [Brachionus plicatilis]
MQKSDTRTRSVFSCPGVNLLNHFTIKQKQDVQASRLITETYTTTFKLKTKVYAIRTSPEISLTY